MLKDHASLLSVVDCVSTDPAINPANEPSATKLDNSIVRRIVYLSEVRLARRIQVMMAVWYVVVGDVTQSFEWAVAGYSSRRRVRHASRCKVASSTCGSCIRVSHKALTRFLNRRCGIRCAYYSKHAHGAHLAVSTIYSKRGHLFCWLAPED
jgi:hypothetical protein